MKEFKPYLLEAVLTDDLFYTATRMVIFDIDPVTGCRSVRDIIEAPTPAKVISIALSNGIKYEDLAAQYGSSFLVTMRKFKTKRAQVKEVYNNYCEVNPTFNVPLR